MQQSSGTAAQTVTIRALIGATEVYSVTRPMAAGRLLDMGNASAALQIAMRMFELTDAEDLNYVDEDDGDWWLADTLENYGKLLVESIASDNVPQEEKDEVIEKLKKMVKSEIWNFGYCEMNKLLQEASAASQSDDAVLQFLNEMMLQPIASWNGKNWNLTFTDER